MWISENIEIVKESRDYHCCFQAFLFTNVLEWKREFQYIAVAESAIHEINHPGLQNVYECPVHSLLRL